MKKIMFCAAMAACLEMWGGNAFAENAQPEYQVDPALTNQAAAYPSPEEALPPHPVPPVGGLSDTKGFFSYQKAVDEYIKAARKYIDGATNDANDIIAKRNEAVTAANDTVTEYNLFLDKNAKKS